MAANVHHEMSGIRMKLSSRQGEGAFQRGSKKT